MGGSWDATRLAESTIAGLTNVGSDHAAWLGADRQVVARDKGRALVAAERAVIGSGVDDLILPAIEAPNARPVRHLVKVEDLGDGRASVRWDDGETCVDLPWPGPIKLPTSSWLWLWPSKRRRWSACRRSIPTDCERRSRA